MSRFARWSFAFVALVVIGIGVTLAYAPDPRIAQYRKELTLEQEPAGSVTIEDARTMIESETHVVLAVRTGVRDLSAWWNQDTASFHVSEATPGSHYSFDPHHDPTT